MEENKVETIVKPQINKNNLIFETTSKMKTLMIEGRSGSVQPAFKGFNKIIFRG